MRVCLTGGAGFIGSHILAELLAERHEVLVIDNFANSSPESLRRVRKITDASFDILEEDICNSRAVAAALLNFRPDCVIHCAGLKAVGESQEKPMLYHRVNVGGAMSLLEAMDAASCSQIIFSSSATVYGTPEYLPYDEAHPVAPANVYGRTKVAVENMIADWAEAGPSRAAVNLRYFNPVGAHPSGKLARTRWVSPTIWFLTSPMLLVAFARHCRSLAMTTKPGTAPVSGITSTLSILRPVILRPCCM